jgi:hypothetical protein
MIYLFGDSFAQCTYKEDTLLYQKTYPAILANHYKTKVKSYARGGVANSFIFKSFNDLFGGIKKFNDDDIVIINITASSRIWFWENSPELTDTKKVQAAWKKEYVKFFERGVNVRELHNFYKFYQLYMHFFYFEERERTLIENFILSLIKRTDNLNKPPIIIPCFDDEWKWTKKIVKKKKLPIIVPNLHLDDISRNEIKGTIPTTHNWECRINHLMPENHLILADKIINADKNTNNINFKSNFKKDLIESKDLENLRDKIRDAYE